MFPNFNIGILGHVDSGKTTLARNLSTVGSTAAFDKNPQSQQRGITLDLGFSGLVLETSHLNVKNNKLQITLVDCPGHASLIRTIIGGAQIIDLMILVIDSTKGIQTQTAECLVIGEITCDHLIVALNKIDILGEQKNNKLEKLTSKLRKVFADTKFGREVPMIPVSAIDSSSSSKFLEQLKLFLFIPERKIENPFLFAVDHCFTLKGKGTICTGTVLEGKISTGDEVEIPAICEKRKVKSMQMFRNSVQEAKQGDRVGVCVPNFNADTLERGVLAAPGSVKRVSHAVIQLKKIKYFKGVISSKSKFHITIGHQTVMAKVILFEGDSFSLEGTYEFVDEVNDSNDRLYCLLEFESTPLVVKNALVIGSKLDIDEKSNLCRIAFYGKLEHFWTTGGPSGLSIYKNKRKEGRIQRYVNEHELIVQNLFKKECDPKLYQNKKIYLSTGESGYLDSPFGHTGKIRVRFLEALEARESWREIKVIFEYKKFIFNKQLAFFQ